MGLQAAVHLGHMPWALTKEEEGPSSPRKNSSWTLIVGPMKKMASTGCPETSLTN
jgi:hypothetical protein